MITLVLGGTRSGKSAIAEAIADRYAEPVTYVATASVDPDDPDHVARIAAHRARRPEHWVTIETASAADLARVLGEEADVVLVDSLGTWVTLHPDLAVDARGLLDALAARIRPTVIVSEEVGLSVHPPTDLGRRYVDAVGDLNQQVAAIADRVLFVIAGRAIDLPLPDTRPGSP